MHLKYDQKILGNLIGLLYKITDDADFFYKLIIWLVFRILWHIKLDSLFNAKSCLYEYKYTWFASKYIGLV